MSIQDIQSGKALHPSREEHYQNCSKLIKITLVEVKCKFKSVRTIFLCNKQIFNKLKKNLYIFSGH